MATSTATNQLHAISAQVSAFTSITVQPDGVQIITSDRDPARSLAWCFEPDGGFTFTMHEVRDDAEWSWTDGEETRERLVETIVAESTRFLR